MKFSQAVEGFLLFRAVDGSEHTARDYANTLRQWARFLVDDPDVEAITVDDVRRFLYFLRTERELAPKSVKNAHTGMSAFFTWLEAEYGLRHVMRGRVPSPRAGTPEIVPMTKMELRALLAAVERTAVWKSTKRAPATTTRATRARDKAIILVLLDTGIRAQELCSLKLGDLDVKTGALQVRKGKGDKGRTVYLGVTARAAVWSYVSKRTHSHHDDPIFETAGQQPLDRAAVRKMLARAGERAEITEPVYPHRLRHTFAINYLRNGGDVFTLQRLLGHSSMDMVRRYLALAQVDVAEAHRRASPADNWRLG